MLAEALVVCLLRELQVGARHKIQHAMLTSMHGRLHTICN